MVTAALVALLGVRFNNGEEMLQVIRTYVNLLSITSAQKINRELGTSL